MLSPEERDVRYQQWRDRIPFTNDQIADEILAYANECPEPWIADRFREMSERCRTHRLSAAMLRFALPRLVKFCGLCGAKALYRYGIQGRCREHKWVATEGFKAVFKQREHGAAEYEQLFAESDRVRESLRRFHQYRKKNQGRP
jgi:hypothetical protein